MNTDLITLCLREQKRRRMLWALECLYPGAEAAKPLLAELEDIDHQDLENPIGDACSVSIEELREHVPETPFKGRDGHLFVIVLDQHIPQPWQARFAAGAPYHHGCPRAAMLVTGGGFYDAGYRRCSTYRHIENCEND